MSYETIRLWYNIGVFNIFIGIIDKQLAAICLEV